MSSVRDYNLIFNYAFVLPTFLGFRIVAFLPGVGWEGGYKHIVLQLLLHTE